jgi:hypothetical protein
LKLSPGKKRLSSLQCLKRVHMEIKASTRVKPVYKHDCAVQAREAVAGPMPDVPVGQHCTQPYPCQA